MIKLLLCILSATVLAVLVLQLRQERMELNYQINLMHDDIEDLQTQLWQQQIQIAIATAPNSIAGTIGKHELQMTPAHQEPVRRASTDRRETSPR